MNQTKKRLSIINLAISITDIETIQLQVLKLRMLQSDEKVQEILQMLQNENYGQAQSMIQTYIDTPNKEILQRTFQTAHDLHKEVEKELEKEKKLKLEKSVNENDIETSSMFRQTAAQNNSGHVRTLDLNDMLEMAEEAETFDPTVNPLDDKAEDTENETVTKETEEKHILDIDEMMAFEHEVHTEENERKVYEDVNFDDLLSVDADDILPDNVDIDISHDVHNDFWDGDASQIEENTKDADSFFDENSEDNFQPITESEELATEEPSIPNEKDLDTKEESIHYKAIPYIDQKLKNMQVQYPLLQPTNVSFESVDTLLTSISKNAYTDEEIDAVFHKVEEIQDDNEEEAALLLLTIASTESKYAQFQLGRALYKGTLLQQNIPEAFTLIHRLAVNDDYPEAVCDLAQFYEHGIGVDKDKEEALKLYTEAMQAGIHRAAAHVERLTSQNKGLFSFLKK